MGKLRSGILGHLSGKVAGVVGTKWKDKSVLREYVFPANPNTTLQQGQRAKFGRAVAFGKLLVGQIFNVYVDKFQKSMSGFNYFISQNIAIFTSPPTYASIKVTWGNLWGVVPYTAVYSSPDIALNWNPALLGNNGASTDKIYCVVTDALTRMKYFPVAEVARSVGSIIIPAEAGLTVGNLKAYIFAARYSLTSPTLLEMVSNSTYTAIT